MRQDPNIKITLPYEVADDVVLEWFTTPFWRAYFFNARWLFFFFGFFV
jgi:hypothetical protein